MLIEKQKDAQNSSKCRQIAVLALLIALNLLTTAAYGIIAKVTQDTFGEKNSAWLNFVSEVIAASMALSVLLVGKLTGKIQLRSLGYQVRKTCSVLDFPTLSYNLPFILFI